MGPEIGCKSIWLKSLLEAIENHVDEPYENVWMDHEGIDQLGPIQTLTVCCILHVLAGVGYVLALGASVKNFIA